LLAGDRVDAQDRGMFPILFRDDHVVAIHKPAGLLVHRTTIDAHERRAAVQLLRRQLGRRVYPVHRLDKGASGVLLFALSREVGQALNASFARRQVEKTYLAVVRGYPPECGEIDYPLTRPRDGMDRRRSTGIARRLSDMPIRRDPSGSGPAEGTPAAGPSAREALTRFRRLATVELPHRVDRYPTSRYALVQLEPLTGRRHQLRRHLKHLSHPIIGDATYGKSRHNRLFHDVLGCHRLLLACVELQFVHPVTGEQLVCSAALDTDFATLLHTLGWEAALPSRWLP
jgi:tRNA pseudouridine65 synthase